jgi:hypothetical protein
VPSGKLFPFVSLSFSVFLLGAKNGGHSTSCRKGSWS